MPGAARTLADVRGPHGASVQRASVHRPPAGCPEASQAGTTCGSAAGTSLPELPPGGLCPVASALSRGCCLSALSPGQTRCENTPSRDHSLLVFFPNVARQWCEVWLGTPAASLQLRVADAPASGVTKSNACSARTKPRGHVTGAVSRARPALRVSTALVDPPGRDHTWIKPSSVLSLWWLPSAAQASIPASGPHRVAPPGDTSRPRVFPRDPSPRAETAPPPWS